MDNVLGLLTIMFVFLSSLVQCSTDDDKTNTVAVQADKKIQYTKMQSVSELEQGVHLISASWCGYCTELRGYFRTHQVPFTEYNVATDAKVNKYLEQKNLGRGVPITVINGNVIRGFDEEAIRDTLKKQHFL